MFNNYKWRTFTLIMHNLSPLSSVSTIYHQNDEHLTNDSTFSFNFLVNLIIFFSIYNEEKNIFFLTSYRKIIFFTHLLCIVCTRILYIIYIHHRKFLYKYHISFSDIYLNNLFYDGWIFILLLTHFCSKRKRLCMPQRETKNVSVKRQNIHTEKKIKKKILLPSL